MKTKADYLRRVRKLAKLELYPRNAFLSIKQSALWALGYSAGIVDQTGGDFELLDRKSRKILACKY